MKKERYRLKFQERWYTSELCNHPGIPESYFMIEGHIILKKDVEIYYSLKNEKKG
jgi:hypothetical protein